MKWIGHTVFRRLDWTCKTRTSKTWICKTRICKKLTLELTCTRIIVFISVNDHHESHGCVTEPSRDTDVTFKSFDRHDHGSVTVTGFANVPKLRVLNYRWPLNRNNSNRSTPCGMANAFHDSLRASPTRFACRLVSRAFATGVLSPTRAALSPIFFVLRTNKLNSWKRH